MMVIGIITVRLAIYQATSLKDKRRVVKSLKDRIRRRFNVSVAETDALEARQRAVLTAAIVANEARFVNQCLQQVLNLIQGDREAALVDYSIETL